MNIGKTKEGYGHFNKHGGFAIKQVREGHGIAIKNDEGAGYIITGQ